MSVAAGIGHPGSVEPVRIAPGAANERAGRSALGGESERAAGEEHEEVLEVEPAMRPARRGGLHICSRPGDVVAKLAQKVVEANREVSRRQQVSALARRRDASGEATGDLGQLADPQLSGRRRSGTVFLDEVGELPLERLARSFVAAACRRWNHPVEPVLGAEALEVLRACWWPGNIRELKNVMERAVLLCTEGAILPEHLPLEKMRVPRRFLRSGGGGSRAGGARRAAVRRRFR